MDTERLKEIAKQLHAMPKGGDQEDLHCQADGLLCEALRILDAPEIADEFNRALRRVGFWYA